MMSNDDVQQVDFVCIPMVSMLLWANIFDFLWNLAGMGNVGLEEGGWGEDGNRDGKWDGDEDDDSDGDRKR